MRLLLDTHVLLWWLAADSGLSGEAHAAIAEGANTILISAASAWEMAIKRALGKLTMPDLLDEAITASGFQALPITVAHALLAGGLPRHHDDPFDRMLIAQAQSDGLTIVTRDTQFSHYGVRTILA